MLILLCWGYVISHWLSVIFHHAQSIVGSKDINYSQYEWMVYLEFSKSHWIGFSLKSFYSYIVFTPVTPTFELLLKRIGHQLLWIPLLCPQVQKQAGSSLARTVKMTIAQPTAVRFTNVVDVKRCSAIMMTWVITWQLFIHSCATFAIWTVTCDNSGIEIPMSLQCKILQYKILWQLPMEVKDIFSLCKMYHPAWIQVDHRNLRLSEIKLFWPMS